MNKPVVTTKSEKKNPLTRAKALKLLRAGADPNDERFLKHTNYHVVDAARRLAAKAVAAVPCNGLCEPMCTPCNEMADQAADNRVINQGY